MRQVLTKLAKAATFPSGILHHFMASAIMCQPIILLEFTVHQSDCRGHLPYVQATKPTCDTHFAQVGSQHIIVRPRSVETPSARVFRVRRNYAARSALPKEAIKS